MYLNIPIYLLYLLYIMCIIYTYLYICSYVHLHLHLLTLIYTLKHAFISQGNLKQCQRIGH